MQHLIRSINDPEHPLSLEELNVVEQFRVKVGFQIVQFIINVFLISLWIEQNGVGVILNVIQILE